MRPVKWQKEYWDGRFPFCPYCNEFAYEKDHCVFCEKPYRWREPWRYKTRTVTVGEYTVGQASNHHVMIAKDGRMVYHASCTKRMSKRKLKDYVKLYETMCVKESNHDRQANQSADC